MRARPPYPALLVALAAVLAVLPALGGAEGAAGRTTLTLGVDQEVVGLDPTKVTAFSSFRRLDLLYNRLVTYDAGLHIVGDLAESWTTPDARTYVFHLRKGVRFHDGAEMTSEDVVYTIQRILDPKTASPGRSYLDAVDSVTAPDRYTVRFHLKYPLASLLSGLASGNAAISDGSVVKQALADRALQVLQAPSLNLRIFSFNTTRPPFTDPRVRQAIAFAIDRQAIVNAAEFGLGVVSGPIPAPDRLWALPVREFPEYHPDPARARRMLQEAGALGAAFKITASPTYEGGLAVAQVIQNQLRAVGLNPSIENVEWGQYITLWVKRDFDTMVELRGGDPDPDRFLYRTFYSTGAVNNFLFKDPAVDRLLDRGRVHLTLAERRPIYHELERLLVKEAPAVFLYTPMETQVLQRSVRGFQVIPTGSLELLQDTSIQR